MACLIVSLGFVACSSNPVAEVSVIQEILDNNRFIKPFKTNKISEIVEPILAYEEDGCFFKE
ncbi:MAG: hypothetical protein PF588_00185 [Candidatus Kapabacteria bacterium]|nr:hypothetical protein [Candidatus Kapabacteria bacterium]